MKNIVIDSDDYDYQGPWNMEINKLSWMIIINPCHIKLLTSPLSRCINYEYVYLI